ncbi:MAG: hypothetical protein J7K54_00450, partial [Candidatus Aenigmarchaeota archaeon]|nr:hypothetical protein [Candidatus Aenigmarchaeota archaeon]
ILIVIIVAAALYALGVFNPTTWTGSRATGFANVGAPTEWTLDGSTDTFTLVLPNHVGVTINVTSVDVDLGGGNNITTTFNTNIAAGDTHTFSFTMPSDVTSGSPYSAEVTVKYIKASGTLELTDTGTLTGTAS